MALKFWKGVQNSPKYSGPGCQDCIIIADKFFSRQNSFALLNAGMQYIFPLLENTANIERKFYRNTDEDKWDDVFTHHKRTYMVSKTRMRKKGNLITLSGQFQMSRAGRSLRKTSRNALQRRGTSALKMSLKRSGWGNSLSTAILISRQ